MNSTRCPRNPNHKSSPDNRPQHRIDPTQQNKPRRQPDNNPTGTRDPRARSKHPAQKLPDKIRGHLDRIRQLLGRVRELSVRVRELLDGIQELPGRTRGLPDRVRELRHRIRELPGRLHGDSFRQSPRPRDRASARRLKARPARARLYRCHSTIALWPGLALCFRLRRRRGKTSAGDDGQTDL